MTTFTEFEIHLEQQLILERWAVDRNIKDVDLFDLTDFIWRSRLIVTNFQDIDEIFKTWSQ